MARANIHWVCWYYDIPGTRNFNEAKATAKILENKALGSSRKKIGGCTTDIQVLMYREKTTLRRRRKDSLHKAAKAETLAR